ncbi:MAG TPA: tRNA (adenosine(37)-N6)-threonylcarbamoyltransferase complex transferase subunit TsaD [Lacunisphaera sp.]
MVSAPFSTAAGSLRLQWFGGGWRTMILALESSCDETAVAIFDPARGMVGEWIHSQIALHESYGGVVPDLASREHLQYFGPLLTRALGAVPASAISRVAVTNGPGLAACLAMGLSAGKALGLAWDVPVVGVNHLRAHAFSPFIGLHAASPETFDGAFAKLLPHLGLLVSGGNTALFTIDEQRNIRLLASTMDDAAGEALDKGAKLLGLGYPGGPQVEKLAREGNPNAFAFPKAVAQRSSLEFSFSGLKTSLRYQLEKLTPTVIEARRADLCASYQQAVFESLVRKSRLALERSSFATGYRSFGLSGGVANNQTLQVGLEKLAREHSISFHRAQPRHTGDNAGMVAFAAWVERERGGVNDAGFALEIAPSLPLVLN